MWALILKNKVWQIEEQKFPFAAPGFWVECGPEITTEHTYVNGQFVEPVEHLPLVIPDTVFQKAAKIMIKAMMGFINGTISKAELNNIFDNVKNYLKET